MKSRTIVCAAGTACVLACLGIWANVSAQGSFPNPNTCDPAECGSVSPLIPMQSVEAVHMGLVWKKNSLLPKILFHARFPEFTPNDMSDPELIDLAIAWCLSTPGLQFNSSLRDVLHGFDPFLGLGTERSADDSFQRLTYGGYLMRQGLSQSVPTRIVANRTMERQLLFDINHPDAFKNSGKFHTALLDEADFAMNRAAFFENGYSKGMFYNTYCNARVTLADGRVSVLGGHDMQSNNGLYKVNIFDPETETWVKRTEPCTRQNWTKDPFGTQLVDEDPNAPFYPGCESPQPTLIDTASEVRPYCCPTASLLEIDANGETVSHKWLMISGQNSDGDQTGTVESIEFTDANPKWQIVGSILQPLATTKAVLLPDGKVLIGQGVNRSTRCNVDGRPCTYEEKEGLHFQMFDPTNASITKLARTTVSRGLHGTATLLPDGTVFFAGGNREALVRPDDPSFPLMTSYAGLLPAGDEDQGVPVGQIFSPPYLFQPGGGLAARPVIVQAPARIPYGGHVLLRVAGPADQIASVVLLRSDHNTHSLTTGDRYVKLAFVPNGGAAGGHLRVKAPNLPAQAVPGIYLLYVVNKNGVPSVGRRVDVLVESEP